MLSYAQLGVAAVGITMDHYPLGFSSLTFERSPATSCTVDGWKGCDFYPLFVSTSRPSKQIWVRVGVLRGLHMFVEELLLSMWSMAYFGLGFC